MKRGYEKFYTTVLDSEKSDIPANKVVYARYELEGRRILKEEYPKAELFVHQQKFDGVEVTDGYLWYVTEGKSGLGIINGYPTRKEAIHAAIRLINENGGEKGLMRQVNKMVEKLKQQGLK